ncbi:hypothetical protein [Hoeflea sp.]|uniref:hypothetical protein n=1 Tax=Hoeflea sp. TaxID=1940281 RepID=UPI0019AA3162|nr:hypothetical protein [Hoeflea sp.]MBC7280032.1 hypothetical protein [Hoeflea sp.]
MSKTHKFRITVTTGGGRFAPGEPVPVGGKTGISPEEIASIENVHGKWSDDGTTGLPASAARTAELEAARSQLAAANARIDALMAVIAATETVDAAAQAVGAENAPDTALDDLSAAEAALTEARKAAGLPDIKGAK